MSRFVSGKDRTPEYERVVAAIRALLDQAPDLAERACAEALSDHRLQRYIKDNGVRPASGRCAVERVVGKRAPDLPLYRRFMDHVGLFNKDGKPHVFTAQPYHLDMDDLRDILGVCDALGLTAIVRGGASWWSPGATMLVELRKGVNVNG